MSAPLTMASESSPQALTLAERLLMASNGIDEAKALCWAIRMAASDLADQHRDGIRAIEDGLMDRLDAIGVEIDKARAEMRS